MVLPHTIEKDLSQYTTCCWSKNSKHKRHPFLLKTVWPNIQFRVEFRYVNILQASLLSMKRAINKLKKKPDQILIDGPFAPNGLKNYKTIIKGDEKIKSIGAASIIAKTYRDLLMIKLSEKFTHYAWERNFGYGTKAHMEGLKKFGITPHHRKGFKPIHNMLLR